MVGEARSAVVDVDVEDGNLWILALREDVCEWVSSPSASDVSCACTLIKYDLDAIDWMSMKRCSYNV
jgi:hypothetical protein